MALSFRGKEVDMVSLAKRQGDAVALGNAHMNGRGDLLEHGKVVKTREEVLADWYATHTVQKETVGLNETPAEQPKQEEVVEEPTVVKAKPRKPKELVDEAVEEKE